MHCSGLHKMKIKTEDIIIWTAIIIIIAIAIWKLVGSPTDTAALISITLFIAVSELSLWKKMFLMEKKTEVGFMKVKENINLSKSPYASGLLDARSVPRNSVRGLSNTSTLRNDLKHYLNNT